jgi:hypothetical protein
MDRNLDEIASAALQLNVESRANLTMRLLDSLDELSPDEVQQLWVQEAIRRNRQIDDGSVETYAAEDVIAELRARTR